MKYNKYSLNLYNVNISLYDIVKFLKNLDTPLGDLCSDIIKDENFPFDNIELAWIYLNNIKNSKGNYLDEPIRRLKTVYSTIVKS